MNPKIISLFVIVTIVFSSFSFAHSDYDVAATSEADHAIKTVTSDHNSKSTVDQQSKNHVIQLSESLGMQTNGDQRQISQPTISDENSQYQKSIDLHETLMITANNLPQNIVFMIRYNPNQITTMEKISNMERIRFNGRSIIVSTIPTYYESYNELSNKKFADQFFNTVKDDYIISSNLVKSIFSDAILKVNDIKTSDDTDQIIIFTSLIQKNLVSDLHNFVGPDYPVLVILLAPISGFILARADNIQFNFIISRRFVSLCFVIILVGSSIVSPVSISHNYWGFAYADSENATLNSSQPIQDNSTISQNSQIENLTLTANNTIPVLLPPNTIDTGNQVNSPAADSLNLSDMISLIPTNATNYTEYPPSGNLTGSYDVPLNLANGNETTESPLSGNLAISDNILLNLINSDGTPQSPLSSQIGFSDEVFLSILHPQLPNATKS